MLDTLLHIGKTLRSAGLMKHHRFIKPAPLEDKKIKVTYLQLPVRADFSFDFDGITPITDEDLIRHKLYYLKYKTTEADNQIRYIFGDICYGVDSKGKEDGNYQTRNDAKKISSSFHRSEKHAKGFNNPVIGKFRNAFEEYSEKVEDLLRLHSQGQKVFLHFDLDEKHWYEWEGALDSINQKIVDEFLAEQKDYYVLKKSLYKTIASADKDVQFPNFTDGSMYKAKGFKSTDEFMDLLYAIDYSKKPTVTEGKNIKIIVLPKGEKLEATQIENFFERRNLEVQDQAEAQLNEANEAASSEIDQSDFFDSIFENVLANSAASITQYDFVFSKKGGSASTPDVDMLEVAGIERSFLADLGKRVVDIRRPLLEKRNELYPKRPKDFAFLDIRKAFLNILGDVTSDKKKYQSHLFKVLPQIYTGTYYHDPMLLPAFVEKVEFNIRDPKAKIIPIVHFNLLKYDYYFLTHLLNSDGEKQMEDAKNTASYRAGFLLGKMARPLNREIAVFEKNYVGLLSRRISDKRGLMKFSNFINEKLMIHDAHRPYLKEFSSKAAEIIGDISDNEYQKNLCAFGFFDGYFSKYEGVSKNAQLPDGQDSEADKQSEENADGGNKQ